MRSLSYALLPILASLLLIGCVSTKGTRVEGLDKKEPYLFRYSGDKEEAVRKMKRVLVPEGWTLRNEDLEAGVLSAQKTLRKDEKISQTAWGKAVTEAMAGVSAENQKGRLSFLLTAEGDSITRVEMTPKLVVVMQENTGFTSSKSENTSTPPQGHPMVVKYGLALHRTEGFRLLEPDPKRLIQAEKKQND